MDFAEEVNALNVELTWPKEIAKIVLCKLCVQPLVHKLRVGSSRCDGSVCFSIHMYAALSNQYDNGHGRQTAK